MSESDIIAKSQMKIGNFSDIWRERVTVHIHEMVMMSALY
jgi:hypothetical protein